MDVSVTSNCMLWNCYEVCETYNSTECQRHVMLMKVQRGQIPNINLICM